MEKRIYLSICWLAISIKAIAATGSRSDDFLVIAAPAPFLVFMGLGYWVKIKWKARKLKESIR